MQSLLPCIDVLLCSDASCSFLSAFICVHLRFHLPLALADWIALHTLLAVSGMSRCSTPSGFNASSTAPVSDGSDAVHPDSPTPFAPSELILLGTGWSAIAISRSRPARGMQ